MALCFSVNSSESTGSIQLAISLSWSSGSATGVGTARVSCSSEHSPLVVVTEEYSDLSLRCRRVRPLFSAINSLSTSWSRSLTGQGFRERWTISCPIQGQARSPESLQECKWGHWRIQFFPLSYSQPNASNRRVPLWSPSWGAEHNSRSCKGNFGQLLSEFGEWGVSRVQSPQSPVEAIGGFEIPRTIELQHLLLLTPEQFHLKCIQVYLQGGQSILQHRFDQLIVSFR